MPRNFFALCRAGDQNRVRRIPLRADVQDEMERLFDEQERRFIDGRDEEVRFTGDWNPDEDQLLAIEDPVLAAPLAETLIANPTVFPVLDIQNPDNAGVKAVFTHSEAVQERILVQRFMSSQYLRRAAFTLVLDNNQFSRLSEHGFTLGNALTTFLDGNTFKFQSFYSIRTIFTMQHHFEQATNPQVLAFAGHDAFEIEDQDALIGQMDERTRKLIMGITRSGVLDRHPVADIIEKARRVGVDIDDNGGKIVVPTSKRELKTLLRFLEESVFKGVFSVRRQSFSESWGFFVT